MLEPIEKAKIAVHKIFTTYPISGNGQRFLTLKNGKKIFFQIFIKKYGLDGSTTKYTNADILRRVRICEFLDYLVKNYEFIEEEQGIVVLRTYFYTIVIKEFSYKK
jgi:hypothetical protein